MLRLRHRTGDPASTCGPPPTCFDATYGSDRPPLPPSDLQEPTLNSTGRMQELLIALKNARFDRAEVCVCVCFRRAAICSCFFSPS